MKKLLLILIFTALVFQSCKKHSSNIDEDLVPIVFSDLSVTKAITPLGPSETMESLVLASETSNNWMTIYHSTKTYGDTSVDYFANDMVTLGALDKDGNPDPTSSFSPVVDYPTNDKYIFIKALYPYSAIVPASRPVEESETGTDKVTFKITDGNQNIMATARTVAGEYTGQGSGNRDSGSISLTFVRLLSKINFKVKLEDADDVYWGKLQSISFLKANTVFDCYLENNRTVLSTGNDNTGEFSRIGLDKLITSVLSPEIVCSMMVFPTTPEQETEGWQIKVTTQRADGEVRPITNIITIKKPLKAGYESNITITFNKNKELGFLVTVNSWDNVTTPVTEEI